MPTRTTGPNSHDRSPFTVTSPKDTRNTQEASPRQILEHCKLDRLLLSRGGSNQRYRGEPTIMESDPEKEIDVVRQANLSSKKILLLFECENSGGAAGISKETTKIMKQTLRASRRSLQEYRLTHSTDHQLKSRHFGEIDIIRACLYTVNSSQESAFKTGFKEADKYGFTVWNHLALTYYRTISGILGRWTRYELFKDFPST